MKRILGLFTFCTILMTVLYSCQKEYSYETDKTPAIFSLQKDTEGSCLPKNIYGTFIAGAPTDATNYAEVAVDVTSKGAFTIETEEVNGLIFKASGFFAETGLQVIKLVASGVPTATGKFNYELLNGVDFCGFQIGVLAEGEAGPAVFDIICDEEQLAGNYLIGTPLAPQNYIQLNINVTEIGTYELTTPVVNGFSFKGVGTFVETGTQVVTLTATGTPVNSGSTTFSINGSECTFDVPVAGQAVFSINCSGTQVNGTYTEGSPLTAANTVVIPVTVTEPGGVKFETTASNGIKFTVNTFFSEAGEQSLTIQVVGTPEKAAEQTLELDINGTKCAVKLTIVPKAGTDPGNNNNLENGWELTYDGKKYSGTFKADDIKYTSMQTGPITAEALFVNGENIENVAFDFSLAESKGMGTKTYSFRKSEMDLTTTSILATFDFKNPDISFGSGLVYGHTLTVKLTTFNKTTKKVAGTFSGIIKQEGKDYNVTNGRFSGTYQ